MYDSTEEKQDAHLENDAEREDTEPPSLDAEVVLSEEAQEIAEKVSRELLIGRFGMTSWSGRLPQPADLKQYDEIVPGSARELVDELLHESRLAQQSIDLDREVSDRTLSLLESRHLLQVEESQSDRNIREWILQRLWPLLYLPLVIIVIVLFAPIDSWAKAAICIAIMAGYAAPLCIALLRGRVSNNERDVMKIVPEIVASVTSAINKQQAEVPEAKPSPHTTGEVDAGKSSSNRQVGPSSTGLEE